MSRHSSRPPMSCLNDPPRHFSCHDIVVLPVRYALCSDEESSLGSTYKDFTKRFCPAAEIRHHYYTLRLLRPETFLYAYIEGEEDIIQFTVGADSSLSKTKGVSSMLRADSLWLCVSNLDKSVWLAVSDADWTDEFMAEVRNDPAQFMQQFHPATGSSEKSLVFSSPDGSGKQFAAEVGRLVQEFRDKPGYLRALHEYTNELPPSEQAWRQQWTEVLEREGEDPDLIVPRPDNISLLFDPDLEHLQPPEFTEGIVDKRWQWAAQTAPFKWKQNLPEGSPLNALAATSCAQCIALADTVGLAMDCASLHSAALRARQDLLSWYGGLTVLAGYYQDTSIGLDEVYVIPEEYYSKGAPLSKQVIDFLSEAQALLEKYNEDFNATFWRNILFSQGDWSFARAMRAHDLTSRAHALRAQEVFAACVCGLTSTLAGTRALHRFLTSKGAYFADMAARIIKSGIPDDIPCPPLQTEEGEAYKDPRTSLHVIVSAFNGVLMLPKEDGSLPPPVENILKAAHQAVEPYLTPLEKQMLEIPDWALTLWDMQLLDEGLILQCGGTPTEGMYFNAFNPCIKSAGSSVDFLEIATMSGITDLIYDDLTAKREKELGLITITKQGKKLRFDLNVKTTLGIKSVLKITKCALSMLSACKAIYDLRKAKDASEVIKALLSGFSAVAATAQLYASLQDIHDVYSIARNNSRLPNVTDKEARKKFYKERKARVKRHNRFAALSRGAARGGLARAAGIAGVVTSVMDAYEDYENRDYQLVLADILTGFAPFADSLLGSVSIPVFLCIGIYINLTQEKTSELTEFLRSAYFSLKSTHRFAIERGISCAPDIPKLNRHISPLSYKNQSTPPNALFHERGCELWKSRKNQVHSDIYVAELLKHNLRLETNIDVNGKLLKIYIFSSSIAHDSCLKILSAKLGEYDITNLLHETTWTSMYVNDIPCWTCTIENNNFTQTSYIPAGLVLTMKKFHADIEIEVEFTYSKDEEIILAAQKAYKAKLDYFKHKNPDKTEEQMLSEEIKKYLPEKKMSLGDYRPHFTLSWEVDSKNIVDEINEEKKKKADILNKIKSGSMYYIKREKLSYAMDKNFFYDYLRG